MTISKTPTTTIRRFGGTYAVIPSETINLIQNPDALAMLVWLLDRSENWVIRREHLRSRFGLGRDRYDKAMAELRLHGLAWWHNETDPATGRIIDRVLNVGDVPLESVLPKVGKPTTRETPAAGKTDHLPITDILPITDTTTTTRKAKKFVPPTQFEIAEYANQKGFILDLNYFFEFYETAGWIDAGGKPVKNWKLKLLTWNNREIKNGKSSNRRKSQGDSIETVKISGYTGHDHTGRLDQ